MAQSYFISVFFSIPKTGSDALIIANVLGEFIFYLVMLKYVQENKFIISLMCLFP